MVSVSTKKVISIGAFSVASACYCSVSCNAFTSATSASNAWRSRSSPPPFSNLPSSNPTAGVSPLSMSGFPHNEEDIPSIKRISNKKRSAPELSAVAIAAEDRDFFSIRSSTSDFSSDNFAEDWMLPVLSTSFLITANTVGASCLVLPDLAAGPGFATTCAISVVTYLINLVSGLVMAEVAIKQYEASGSEVASSFKDFADASFKSPMISNAIAWVSILTNAGILAFTFCKAGELGSSLLGGMVDPTTASFGFVALVGVMMSSLSGEKLSAVASVCVAGLFASFTGLLLPGLAAVQDPWTTLTAPGVADNCFGSAAQAFPIVLLSLVYQNIVPSVAKILNYDRQKTTASLALGSFIPLAMYMAWCFASMGGGIDASAGMASGVGSLFLTGFSWATVAGSSVGTTMSVAEEFDSFFKGSAADDNVVEEKSMALSLDDYDMSTSALQEPQQQEQRQTANSDVFSVPAVAASLAVPMLGVMIGGNDMTVALGLAGSIGTPLLYGVVPALMAWNQRRQEEFQQRPRNLVPGGMASLGALGLASTGFVGQELAHVMGEVASLAS